MQMKKYNIILVDNDVVKEINYFIDAIDDNNEINIYIGTNSSLILNHSYINNTNYNLKININYTGEKSNVLVNVRGVNNEGTSKVDIDGTLLKNNNNNILDEKIKIININNGKVICKPNMYIKTSQIIANHENAIGNINKDEVFYLMSKGINKENSKKLIIQGYLLSVIDSEELKTKINDCKQELFNLRMKQATGTLENTGRIKELRKTVARIKTILKEREIEG